MSRFISWRFVGQHTEALPPTQAFPTFRAREPHFLTRSSVLKFISQRRIVYFGEIHGQPKICELQLDVAKAMASAAPHLHIVMEHFSVDMNHTLRTFQSEPSFSFKDLNHSYHKLFGTEGHNLEPYRSLLEYAKENAEGITLHGGFIPRNYARDLAKLRRKDDKVGLLKHMREEGYLPSKDEVFVDCYDEDCGTLVSSQAHYNMFAAIMSGNSLYTSPSLDGTERDYRNIFQAQVLKDYSMAFYLSKILTASSKTEPHVLVIGGRGHFQHYLGVPELTQKFVQVSQDEQAMITCVSASEVCAEMEKESYICCEAEVLQSPFVQHSLLLRQPYSFARPLGDVLFVFD